MSHAAASLDSPADEYDRRLAEHRESAIRQVTRLAGGWAAVQVVALTELCASLTLRDRFDVDAVVTVALIWSISLPVSAGALVAALRHWPVLPARSRAAGVVPWAVTLVETTLAAAYWWLLTP